MRELSKVSFGALELASDVAARLLTAIGFPVKEGARLTGSMGIEVMLAGIIIAERRLLAEDLPHLLDLAVEVRKAQVRGGKKFEWG